jgi:hypothetical protein
MLHHYGQPSPHLHATLKYDMPWDRTMAWIYTTPSNHPIFPHDRQKWRNCTDCL